MPLVSYGSDDDSDTQQTPAAAAAPPQSDKSRRLVQPQDDDDDEDDDDPQFDPKDAFGIARIQHTDVDDGQQRAQARAGNSLTVKSAPDVLVQVNSKHVLHDIRAQLTL